MKSKKTTVIFFTIGVLFMLLHFGICYYFSISFCSRTDFGTGLIMRTLLFWGVYFLFLSALFKGKGNAIEVSKLVLGSKLKLICRSFPPEHAILQDENEEYIFVIKNPGFFPGDIGDELIVSNNERGEKELVILRKCKEVETKT